MALGSQWCHQDPLGGLFPICLSSWLGFLAPFVWAEIFGNCIYWCVTHIIWNGNLAVSAGDKVRGNSFIPADTAIWIKSVFPTLQGKLISICQSSCDCPRRVLWLRSDFMCDISLTILISKIVIFFIKFFILPPPESLFLNALLTLIPHSAFSLLCMEGLHCVFCITESFCFLRSISIFVCYSEIITF